jgi:glucosamine-phosphate N-acetyltransferase
MIRQLTHKDYEDYVELLRQLTDIGEVTQRSFSEFVKMQLSTYDGHGIVEQFPITKVFVVEVDKKVVGCVSVILEMKLKGKALHIEDVVTHKDFRGKGIGAELMEHCKSFAKKNNCYKIVLDCSNDNVAFYEKSGFKVTGNYMSIKF